MTFNTFFEGMWWSQNCFGSSHPRMTRSVLIITIPEWGGKINRKGFLCSKGLVCWTSSWELRLWGN
jgi:hypothetical protein